MPVVRVMTTLCSYKTVDSTDILCEVHMPEPTGKPVPVVLFFHGGALISGDKTQYNTCERDALLKAGYAFVSANYRLAPESCLTEIIEDVRDALDWVRGEGANLFGFDPDRVGILGSSGGSYLALMTGTFSHKPQAIVSFYGYGDILGDWYCKPDPFYLQEPMVSEEEAMKNVTDGIRTEGDCGRYYLRARQLGTWTEWVGRMDPVKDRAELEKYCPLFQITDEYPPTYLLHGDIDTDVPYQQSVQMYEALKKNGNTVEFYTEHCGGHGFDGSWWNHPEKVQMMVDFFQKYV